MIYIIYCNSLVIVIVFVRHFFKPEVRSQLGRIYHTQQYTQHVLMLRVSYSFHNLVDLLVQHIHFMCRNQFLILLNICFLGVSCECVVCTVFDIDTMIQYTVRIRTVRTVYVIRISYGYSFGVDGYPGREQSSSASVPWNSQMWEILRELFFFFLSYIIWLRYDIISYGSHTVLV